jgi:hypothetical protein
MIHYDVVVEGLREAIQRLERFDAIAERHLSRAMLNSARDVAKTTRALAPVGETGQLRAGVDHELLVGSSIGEIAGRIVDRTFYSLWVEFGTAYPSSVRAIAATITGTRKAAIRVARTRAAKRTAGRHFMYRAFVATRGRVMDHFARALDDLTAELGGRGAH